MSMKHIERFRHVLEAAGLSPAEILGDGKLHRCPTTDKPHGKDGAYILHLNGYVSGWWQNWRTGASETWTAEGQREMTPQEQKSIQERMARDRKARLAALEQRHSEAADKAQTLFQRFRTAPEHTLYLKSKGVCPAENLRINDTGDLVVPILDLNGNVQSLQFIFADGKKRFLSGGKKAGGFFPIKGMGNRLFIVEGLATGLSVHEATGSTVFCAFDAGNLKAVAELARKQFPQRDIIIAGDNDLKTDGNPGKTKAEEAARAIGGKWVVPQFMDRPELSDFNDLHQLAGLEAVQKRLSQTQAPGMPGVPRGFILRKDGVHFLEEDKDGVPSAVKVCSPLHVVALTRDAEGEAWGRLLEFTDPEGKSHQWAMPMSMLAGRGDEYRKELLHKGLCIEPGSKAQNRLQSYLSSSNPKRYARCVPRVGWHGGQFVFPDEVYGSEQAEQVILQTECQRNPFTVQGSLVEWKNNVAALCEGNSRLVFAVSLALAAPLLEVAGQESGGIHFVGGSSTGKTTVLQLAGTTAGGGGINGFIEQWRATDNGLEATAAMHCDCPLLLDEVGQASGKVAGEVAYMLANGQGKNRANRTGGNKPSLQWRTLFLSTGEITLSDKIKEDKFSRAMAGQPSAWWTYL
jgi:putative DNA primase/helicase